MSGKSAAGSRYTVADVAAAMETIAPVSLAQEWDRVGLVAGDPAAPVKRMLIGIDLSPPVVDEAVREKADLVLAYHPPIFTPITSLRASSKGTDAVVFRCIRRGIAVYTTHTALDAASGGTNDTIASLIGIVKTEPLEYVDKPGEPRVKLVVFVPPEHLDAVAEAMFAAGAGHIGDYSRCSYRTRGVGSFFGGECTDPAVGKRGRMEYVAEVRFETVVRAKDLANVVRALGGAHPYEEPAYDIYPLDANPVPGIGRYGKLPRPATLAGLARRLKKAAHTANPVQIVGDPDRRIERAVIVVGAAGKLPFRLALTSGDVIITGEIRHHDALTVERLDCSAIALGHWASERPVLEPLSERLRSMLPGLTLLVSAADRDPFQTI